MKPEAQRIAIAEACGWISEDISRHAMYYVPSEDIHIGNPIYDLNAMHEAESWLKNDDPHAFACYLADLFESHGCDAIHLSPAQRAEVLLRTINKWEDEP
jgi:hypothetical protein